MIFIFRLIAFFIGLVMLGGVWFLGSCFKMAWEEKMWGALIFAVGFCGIGTLIGACALLAAFGIWK